MLWPSPNYPQLLYPAENNEIPSYRRRSVCYDPSEICFTFFSKGVCPKSALILILVNEVVALDVVPFATYPDELYPQPYNSFFSPFRKNR